MTGLLKDANLCQTPQGQRVHDDRPNSLGSRPQRVRRAYEGPPDTVYDVPSPEIIPSTVLAVRFIPKTLTLRPNNEPPYANSVRGRQRDTENGTIQWDVVQGLDFIFPFPAVGPGYYVVRCDRAIN